MDRGIIGRFKQHSTSILIVLLILCTVIYCLTAALPKHGDFWILNYKAKAFSLYGFDFTGKIPIYYPSTFYILQGIWIALGSQIFGYDLQSWTTNFNLVPNYFQVWCMIPFLVGLLLIVAISYFCLKNKWLALLAFGTLSFISVVVMGQLEVFLVVFMLLSMIVFLKAIKDKDEHMALLSVILLGLSVQYVPFAAFLLPVYLIFSILILRIKKYDLLKISGYLILALFLFILAFIVIWLIHPTSLLQMSTNGEPGWLINLQLGPVDLPPYHVLSIWLLGYIVILYDAFYNLMKCPEKMLNDRRYFIYYSFIIYAWFFIAVFTHPQWWLVLLPPVLLVLDNFRSWLNYLFAFALMLLYIFLPMMWTNNIDIVLQYYLPTFDITANYAIVLATLIVSVLVVWALHIRREIRDEEPSDAAGERPMADMAFPILITFAPYAICFLAGMAAVATIGCASIDFADNSTAVPGGEIYGNTTISQAFTARYDNLNSVDVLMQGNGRASSDEVLFHLKGSPTSGDIAVVSANAGDIQNNKYHSFKFPKIPDSKGKTYYFSIESTRQEPGSSVTVFVNTWGDHKGDIVFRPHYKPGLQKTLSYIGNKYPIVSF